MTHVYLMDVLILLAAAVIVVPLARLIGLGTVPGFLLAGMLVGPSVFGLIGNRGEIEHLAEFGVVLLLFVVGVELKPAHLWSLRKQVFGLGAAQVVITGLAISALAYYAFGLSQKAAILIGPALALSSTAFVLQLLQEQKMMRSKYGRSAVAVLLFQDLAVVPLLVLVSLLAATGLQVEGDLRLRFIQGIGILVLVILAGRYLLQPLLQRIARYGSTEVFTASALLLVLGVGVLMTQIGLSMAMGAFIAGLLVADSEFRHQIIAEIQPFRGLLLGLFFMSMGMSLELDALFAKPLVSLALVVGLLTLKAAILWPLARFFGEPQATARALALLLAQSGEFALVLFAVASNTGLLEPALFQQLLVIVIISMLATPPMAALAYKITIRAHTGGCEEGSIKQHIAPATVVIIGFGRVGRRVGEVLEMRGLKYVALERNTRRVREQRAAGRPVYYGDATQPEVLASLGVGEAGLVVVTVDDFEATDRIVATLSNAFPELDVLARGHNLEHCQRLQEGGAWLAVSENLEASLALADAALSHLAGDTVENSEAVERYRNRYYDKIRKSRQVD